MTKNLNRLLLALTTTALLAATLAPTASANLMRGCSKYHEDNLPEAYCENQPCSYFDAFCAWVGRCAEGPVLQLADRAVECTLP